MKKRKEVCNILTIKTQITLCKCMQIFDTDFIWVFSHPLVTCLADGSSGTNFCTNTNLIIFSPFTSWHLSCDKEEETLYS